METLTICNGHLFQPIQWFHLLKRYPQPCIPYPNNHESSLSNFSCHNPHQIWYRWLAGVIAAEFTFERLTLVAPLAAHVLENTYGGTPPNRTVIVGYDRRFLSEEFARATADAVTAAGFDVLLSEGYAPTPAFSWAAKQHNALGALVITASHNPGCYSGLKVKGAFGGSVAPAVTQQIEALLKEGVTIKATPALYKRLIPGRAIATNFGQRLISKKFGLRLSRKS